MPKSFDAQLLARLQRMSSEDALALLGVHVKADPTYRPVKDAHSRRWHVRSARGEYEILTTGPACTALG